MPFLCIFIILFVATKYNHVENIEFDLLEYIYVALRLAKCQTSRKESSVIVFWLILQLAKP